MPTLAELAAPLGHVVEIHMRPNGRHTTRTLHCRCGWGMWGDFNARYATRQINDHYRQALAEARDAGVG